MCSASSIPHTATVTGILHFLPRGKSGRLSSTGLTGFGFKYATLTGWGTLFPVHEESLCTGRSHGPCLLLAEAFLSHTTLFYRGISQLSLPNFTFSPPSVSSTERLTKVDLGIPRACLPGGCITFLNSAAFATLVLQSLHTSVCMF